MRERERERESTRAGMRERESPSAFFLILFSLCSSDWIISIDLSLSSLIPSSAYSNLLLGPLVNFSFQL